MSSFRRSPQVFARDWKLVPLHPVPLTIHSSLPCFQLLYSDKTTIAMPLRGKGKHFRLFSSNKDHRNTSGSVTTVIGNPTPWCWGRGAGWPTSIYFSRQYPCKCNKLSKHLVKATWCLSTVHFVLSSEVNLERNRGRKCLFRWHMFYCVYSGAILDKQVWIWNISHVAVGWN